MMETTKKSIFNTSP